MINTSVLVASLLRVISWFLGFEAAFSCFFGRVLSATIQKARGRGNHVPFCLAAILFFGVFLFWLFRVWSLSLSWNSRVRVGLLALPLPGAGVTFFAAAKKVTKESSF
jgi:hypothetical protein